MVTLTSLEPFALNCMLIVMVLGKLCKLGKLSILGKLGKHTGLVSFGHSLDLFMSMTCFITDIRVIVIIEGAPLSASSHIKSGLPFWRWTSDVIFMAFCDNEMEGQCTFANSSLMNTSPEIAYQQIDYNSWHFSCGENLMLNYYYYQIIIDYFFVIIILRHF